MDSKFAVLLLLSFSALASAAELKLTGELHYNSVEVTLQNNADREVSFELRFELKEKADGWNLIKRLCALNDSIQPLASKNYSCSYTTPTKPGEYKIYAKADIVGSTYTYKNFLLGKDEVLPGVSKANSTGKNPEKPEPKKDVIVAPISAPDKVKTGEKFVIVANVTSKNPMTLEVYSYVYSGKTCFSFFGWKGNSQKYEFKPGETKTINLTDSVSHEAANGTYSLKVRARDGWAEKDYDAVKPLDVEQVPVDLFREIETNETFKSRPISSGPQGLPIHILLPVFGSIPLLVLLAKKVF